MALTRLLTGIDGVDHILHGGLMAAGVYLVRGSPGAGKTVFANQICFHHVANGGKVGYITLLAESTGRMLDHMGEFSFFHADAVPASVSYVSAFAALKAGGLPGVIALLAAEIRSRQVSLLVLDGLVSVAESARSVQELKLFVSELQAYSAFMNCTILLLQSSSTEAHVTPEQTMVDGVFRLRHELAGSQLERSFQVVKFRGSATIEGLHAMRINSDGITVFPRLEASKTAEVEPLVDGPALSAGVVGFESLSRAGGYPRASVTAVAGCSGSGKTLLGLHFVGQARPQEPALVFGFYESPAALVKIGAGFGLDLESLRQQELIEFMWQPYGFYGLDELADRLLRAIHRTQCKRLFIDGLGGFMSMRAFEERGESFLATLSNELRRLGTTTLMSVESDDLHRFAAPLANLRISAIADNVVRLRIEEKEWLTRRLVSLGKVRGSRLDLSLRELTLTDDGLLVVNNAGFLAAPDAGSRVVPNVNGTADVSRE